MVTRRRVVIAFGVGALAAPLASFAQQQSAKTYRIGWLGVASASGEAGQVEVLRAGLRVLGYVEGKNIAFEYRWAEGKNDQLPELAAELVRLKIDVIVTHGTPGTRATKQATTTIPIVSAYSGDALATGLVANLAKPGGNVTGMTFFFPELSAKSLELLKHALPRIRRVAVVFNSDNPVTGPALRAMEVAAESLKVRLQQFGVRGPKEFDGAFAAIAKSRVDAITVVQDSIFIVNPKAIADLVAKQRLPSAGFMEFAEAGGLIGYGPNLHEMVRHAAYFVDRILKGAKPADLPVEQPTKFEMVVNMKTAKALGIKISDLILLRADKVIE